MNSRSGNFGPKLGKSGKSGFLRGGQNLKFFEVLFFQHLDIIVMSIVPKFEQKWIKTLDVIAHSISKGFDQKIRIFDHRATPNGHKFWIQAPTTMKFCQNVLYMYVLKVKKFQEWTWLRHYSVKQNIEGDANLHHPPGIGLKNFWNYQSSSL